MICVRSVAQGSNKCLIRDEQVRDLCHDIKQCNLITGAAPAPMWGASRTCYALTCYVLIIYELPNLFQNVHEKFFIFIREFLVTYCIIWNLFLFIRVQNTFCISIQSIANLCHGNIYYYLLGLRIFNEILLIANYVFSCARISEENIPYKFY